MSDFGTEVGNTSISLMGKALDALLKILAKLFELFKERTSAEYRLQKRKLKAAKASDKEQEFIKKIDGKAGYIEYDKLVKSGLPLTVTQVVLPEKDFKELARRCKREGISLSGIEDIRERALHGKRAFTVVIKQKDLQNFASLVDLMNDEKRIDIIQSKIDDIEKETQSLEKELTALQALENPTEDEAARIEEIKTAIDVNNGLTSELSEEIKAVRTRHGRELNDLQSKSLIGQATSRNYEEITFDKALNRWTDGKTLDKFSTAYVVDAKNPDNYIACTTQDAVDHKGNDYRKTTYEVYRQDEKVLITDDGRFEGRGKDYWSNVKEEIRAAGEFSDNVFLFYSKEEMEAYRDFYKMQNESELAGLQVGAEARDYNEISKSLESQLDKCGAYYKDGTVYDKETNSPMQISSDMDISEQANIAEAVVIGEQIQNYNDLKQLETSVSIAKANIISADETELSKAKQEFSEIKTKYDTALDNEKSLIEKRKGINAVQANKDVEQLENSKSERLADKELAFDGDEKHITMSEWKEKDKATVKNSERNKAAGEKGIGKTKERSAISGAKER